MSTFCQGHNADSAVPDNASNAVGRNSRVAKVKVKANSIKSKQVTKPYAGGGILIFPKLLCCKCFYMFAGGDDSCSGHSGSAADRPRTLGHYHHHHRRHHHRHLSTLPHHAAPLEGTLTVFMSNLHLICICILYNFFQFSFNLPIFPEFNHLWLGP